jgi:hypothetical protein
MNLSRNVTSLEREVVVVDAFTSRSQGTVPDRVVPASDAEMFKAEHETPDGSAALPHERQYLKWVVGGLASAGLLVVGISMYAVGGVQAMAVGMTWVIAGYAVAWIVVWAAGMARAREEAEIEREIAIKHANKPV